MVTCPAEGLFSNELKKMGISVQFIGNPLDIYPKINSWRSYIKYPYSLLQLICKRHSAYKKLCSCVEYFKPDIIHTNVGPIHIGYLVAKNMVFRTSGISANTKKKILVCTLFLL